MKTLSEPSCSRCNINSLVFLLTYLLNLLQAIGASTIAHDSNGNLTQISSPVAAKPVIATQPTDWSGFPGTTAVFAVRTATDATNTFQWKKNGTNIAGATSESLAVVNVATTDEGLYSVVLTNPKGTVTSRAARLSLDSDNDGLADWQEKSLFSGLAQVGSGDADGDGITNEEEIADGTSPTSRSSRFFRLSLLAQNGSIRAQPQSTTGRYAPGTKVVLTAQGLEGYNFIEWHGQASGLINPVTVTLSSDATVEAVFGSTLGIAVDAPELNWLTDTTSPWLPMGVGGPGNVNNSVDDDWAESTPLSGLGQSWCAAYVDGPATLSFSWQKPTTAAGATLRFYIDGTLSSTATADGVWRRPSISVANGRHLVRWVLDRPAGGTGTDVARLDEVTVSTSANVVLAQAVDAGELPWATYRMNPWFGTTQGSHDGADAASTVLIGQYQESWIETQVVGAGQMTFWYRNNGAIMNVQLDGGTPQSLGSGWTKFTLNITTPGTHIIRWNANTNSTYTYQVTGSVWLDEVVWMPGYVPTPALPISMNAALDNTTLNFTAGGAKPWLVTNQNLRDGVDAAQAGLIGDKAESWIETKVTGPIRVSFYWRVQCDPTDKLQVLVNGQERSFITGSTSWAQTFVDITDQGVHTVRWRYLKDAATISGLDTAWLDTVTTSTLSPGAPAAGTLTPAVADALDKATLGVRTGGTTNWTSDTTTSHDGTDAARSGVITHSQESWMQTAVTGAGKLTFWWKTSCEETFDFLAVQIDGVEQARISGALDWQQKTFTLVGANTHVIRWRYVKDANLSSGADAGWVDQIEWAGAVPSATSTVSPLVLNVGPQARTYTLYLNEAGAWTTAETLTWASLGSAGGTGNVNISVSVDAQTSGKVRSGLLTVAGWTIALNQEGYIKPVITVPVVEAILGVGVPYSLSGFSGLNFPVTWEATGLPPGLTVNATSGSISGTPTAAGKYVASITAKNPGGASLPVKITFIVRGPTLPPFTGVYTGLLPVAGTLPEGLGGLISINVTNATSATGTILIGTQKHAFAGKIAPNIAGNQRLTTSILRKGKTAITLVIDIDTSRWMGRASGTLSGDGDTLEFTAWRNLWDGKVNPATAYAGYYTSALQPTIGDETFPQGYGYVTWTATTAGVVTFAGKAADGTALTGSTYLWPDGQIPFFLQLYKATGALGGMVSINDNRTVSGALNWAKKPQVTPPLPRDYKDGIPGAIVQVEGGPWLAPASGQMVIGLTDAPDNARLDFARGGVESAAQFADLDQVLRITKTHVATIATSTLTNPTGLKMALNVAKGTFTGSFKLTDGGISRPVTFEGVLLSASSEGLGFFTLPKLPLGTPANSDILSGNVILSPVVAP